MFSLINQIEDGPGTKIAWMTGFIWTKNNIMDYGKYTEIWHGKQSPIFGKLHPTLEKSRMFIEHKFVQTIMFIIDIVRLILGLYSIISFFFLFQGASTAQIVFLVIALIIILISPFVAVLAAWRLKKKLKKMLQQLSLEWRNEGLEIRFPKLVKKFCLFITCCSCFDDTDYGTIQIWDFNQISQ